MSQGAPPAGGGSNWMRLELPALPENAALVRVAVGCLAAQLEFTLAEIEEIRVAASEAFSNAVLHAYPGSPPGDRSVTVEARLENGLLEVSVADRGVGIADLEQARRPSYTTLPDRMGLGFVFMETFMDEVTVRTSVGSGTRVVLRKRPAGRGPAETPDEVPSEGSGG